MVLYDSNTTPSMAASAHPWYESFRCARPDINLRSLASSPGIVNRARPSASWLPPRPYLSLQGGRRHAASKKPNRESVELGFCAAAFRKGYFNLTVSSTEIHPLKQQISYRVPSLTFPANLPNNISCRVFIFSLFLISLVLVKGLEVRHILSCILISQYESSKLFKAS